MAQCEPRPGSVGGAIVDVFRAGRGSVMTSAYDYSDLHELIDRLEPEQAEEVRRHALRLVKPAPSRFRILRSFDGPPTDLGARAKDIAREEIGEDDADR